MDSKNKGNRAEFLAKKYYQEKGYTILISNYKKKYNEIDFISRWNDDILVFVEVKYRSSTKFGYPEEFVTQAQKNRIKNLAEEYILEIDWKKDIRFDIVSVDKNYKIQIFKDAF